MSHNWSNPAKVDNPNDEQTEVRKAKISNPWNEPGKTPPLHEAT